MLFTDNAGTRVLAFSQNTEHCYWPASVDTEFGKSDILLKVVNKSGRPENVSINLNGAGNVNPLGHFSTLTGAPDAENSLANPSRVFPATGTLTGGSRFKYTFPASSITVLRLECSRYR
jgi:alpha-N-arabinofuranosidase